VLISETESIQKVYQENVYLDRVLRPEDMHCT